VLPSPHRRRQRRGRSNASRPPREQDFRLAEHLAEHLEPPRNARGGGADVSTLNARVLAGAPFPRQHSLPAGQRHSALAGPSGCRCEEAFR